MSSAVDRAFAEYRRQNRRDRRIYRFAMQAVFWPFAIGLYFQTLYQGMAVAFRDAGREVGTFRAEYRLMKQKIKKLGD